MLQESPEKSTTFLLLDDLYQHKVPHSPQLFAVSLGISVFSIFIAAKLFAAHSGVVSVTFAVLGILPTFSIIVDRHKTKLLELKKEGQKRTAADLRFARNVFAIVMGILLAFSAWALFLPVEKFQTLFASQLGPRLGLSVTNYVHQSWLSITINNMAVLGGTLVLTLFFRLGGALLILAWNASVWGVVFVYFAKAQAASGAVALFSYALIFSAVIPHVLLETLGYILAALAGILILRTIVRGKQKGQSLLKEYKPMGLILLLATSCIALGALIEIQLAPFLLNALGF